MTRDAITLGGDREPPLVLEYAQYRDGMGHDRRLGVLGQRKLFLRPLAHDPRQVLRERLVDFLENLARRSAGFSQFPAHADLLAALPREYECGHIKSPMLKSRKAACRSMVRL